MSEQLYLPAEAQAFAEALESLRGKRLAVLGHVRPDGDCIGSQVGLARVLTAMGWDVVCYNEHRVPPNCQPFVGDTRFESAAGPLETDRIALAVDCADRRRLGERLEAAFPEVYINVDHHISNDRYARHNLIVGSASATAEMLAAFFLTLGLPIDAIAAQALYVGIATDTGQFRFSSTTRDTFAICCRLMDHGADPSAAALALYEQESPAKLALLQRFLASFRLVCGGRACIGIIDNADWRATGAAKEDTEGLVDYARAIAGVEIGVLIEERGESVKGSFRAKDPRQRVDQLARQFNGGGHACAAGFNPQCSLAELLPRLIAALEEHFHQLEGDPS